MNMFVARKALSTLAAAAVILTGGSGTLLKTDALTFVEGLTDRGEVLVHYDKLYHGDLGTLTAVYFQAYLEGAPEVLQRKKVLSRRWSVSKLRERWQRLPLQAADIEPFAASFTAAGGRLQAFTYTRVTIGGKLDAYVVCFVRERGKWVVDIDVGLTTGFSRVFS